MQSPDGDVIDCRPKEGNENETSMAESFQLWTDSGESCPQGTVPIRRTTEKDVLRANELNRFGKKKPIRHSRRDSSGTGHEHAVVFVNGEQYYGAKANINVWAPRVSDPYEFSLSQIWLISGSFGNDLNTIEAGWQVSPELYGDSYPRFFTYWTVSSSSLSYSLLNQLTLLRKPGQDPKHGHWWLQYGPRLLVGYWPLSLFSHLRNHATMVQFGGEIVNSRSSGVHTSTQMGSGHFGEEGYGKASYFRNLKTVDWDNNLLPLSNSKNLHVLADRPGCYDVKQGMNNDWGNFFYYGGPGLNVRCP
ncbi:hypothetical protein LINPERPRIM_LOCUS36576 [Linum perenne]